MSQLATKLRLTHNHLTHMLTDTKIRALKPKAAAYRVADTNGSVIEIRPAGSKAWRYRYRFLGKASIVTLDEYPAMGLQAARAEPDKLRAMLCGGANPAQVARTEKATQGEKATATFAAVGLELLAKRTKEGLVPGSVVRERRLIEKDLAMLADISVSDVTAPILLAALRKLEQRGGARRHTEPGLTQGGSSDMQSPLDAPSATPPRTWLGPWSSRGQSTLPALRIPQRSPICCARCGAIRAPVLLRLP